MHLDDAHDLLASQSGAITRRQLVALGAAPHDLRRWLRKQLMPAHPGVYVATDMPPTWTTRAWAGVLHAWPAALADCSVINRSGDVIHLAVEAHRNVLPRPGIRHHWVQGLQDRVLWNLGPPQLRVEDAALSVAASRDRTQALAFLSDVVRRRLTTPDRLATELANRSNLRHRAWLALVLEDAASGVHSVLESAYVRNVERAHGLPRSDRQVREVTARGVVYRDVLYREYGVCVELDGRLGHEPGRDRWLDNDRDLEAVILGLVTLRFGGWHVEGASCELATRMGQVLAARGWTGIPRPCPRCRPAKQSAAKCQNPTPHR